MNVLVRVESIRRRMFCTGGPSVCHLCVLTLLLLMMLKQGMGHILCHVCDTDTDTDKNTNCVDSPPAPINCTTCMEWDDDGTTCLGYSDMEFCMTVHKYDDGTNMTLIGMIRSCGAFYTKGLSCTSGVDHDRGKEIYMCHAMCRYDGCNSAQDIIPSFWRTLLLPAATCLLLMLPGSVGNNFV